MRNDNGELDWRKMDREALDRGLNNAAAVSRSAAILSEWATRSAELRRQRPEFLDLRYGPRERNRIDFLHARDAAPILVFVHGGYWQTRSKDTFTFIAAGLLAADINVALVGYTLAPHATIGDMVAEVGAALDYLTVELPRLGGDPGRVLISGWSAGAHLAVLQLTHPLVRGGLAISGIYDLEPIRHSYINEKLALDERTARRFSPILNLTATSSPLAITVGRNELPLIRRQSADFARARADRGLNGTFEEVPDADHFTILEHFSPEGRLTRVVQALASR